MNSLIRISALALLVGCSSRPANAPDQATSTTSAQMNQNTATPALQAGPSPAAETQGFLPEEPTSITSYSEQLAEADFRLTEQIRHDLMADPLLSFMAKNVSIITNNKRVVLLGYVKNEQERQQVIRIAKKLAGDGAVEIDFSFNRQTRRSMFRETSLCRSRRRPPVINVLIVLDDEDLAEQLDVGLSRHGFAVTLAGNCADAHEAVAERSFDAIVTDISLPDGSGYELVAALTPRPHAVVVMSDGGTDADERGAPLADVRIEKPIDVDVLAVKLNAVLSDDATYPP